MGTPIVAITDDTSLLTSNISKMITEVGHAADEQHDIAVITQASTLGKIPAELSSANLIIIFCKSVEFPSQQLVGELFRVLKSSGTIIARQIAGPNANKEKSSLAHRLLLAGFIEVETLQGNSLVSSVKGKKPTWSIGSSFTIKKPLKVALSSQLDNDSDLIDEDSLLTEDDLKKPQVPNAVSCEVGLGSTRKACKNCTCGRAEAEEKVKLGITAEQLSNPQSACGSCGLGDAFRCSTCPYKGLPPFKLGEKVSLPQNILVSDM